MAKTCFVLSSKFKQRRKIMSLTLGRLSQLTSLLFSNEEQSPHAPELSDISTIMEKRAQLGYSMDVRCLWEEGVIQADSNMTERLNLTLSSPKRGFSHKTSNGYTNGCEV
jgi:hypothetical protein